MRTMPDQSRALGVPHIFLVVVGTGGVGLLLRGSKAHLYTLEHRRQAAGPPWGWLNVPLLDLVGIGGIGVGLLVLLYVLGRPPSRVATLGLGLLVGGATSNTTERIVFGGITDYIPVPWPEAALANFADIVIVAGFLLFAVPVMHRLIARGWSRPGNPHL